MVNYNKFLRRNRSHYIKWRIDEVNDLSIRFYFKFESKKFKKYENKWVLKSHKDKTYKILSEEEAHKMIQELAITDTPEELFSLSGQDYAYFRFIVDSENKAHRLELEEDYE